MTLKQLETKANTKLSVFATAVQTRQTSYYLKNKKFFQLMVTPPVVDGVDTTWVLKTPSDEKNLADVGFSFNSPIPFAISVDEWVGAESGYSIKATVEISDGRMFSQSRSCVPVIVGGLITDWIEETTAWGEVINEAI